METGRIQAAAITGPFDLQSTLESGQTFRWRSADGETYRDAAPHGGEDWYLGLVDRRPVAIRWTGAALEWRSPDDPTEGLRRTLGLTESMADHLASLPDHPLVAAAERAFPGLRVVREPFFATLVSFVLSAQMRVERIHSLVQALAREYGRAHHLDGETVHAFPTPDRLAAATETELRELGLGYRAPYVRETAEMVASGRLTESDVAGREYEDARDLATEFVGVGEKVADCLLLFGLGYREPVPLDTWITTAIEEHFPEVAADSYEATSRGIRERLGPAPGVAQTYLFHYLRHRETLSGQGPATPS
ncbi:MAG: DNA-3-methyladenine glycosylase [Halanaeroarchaeum sp.]